MYLTLTTRCNMSCAHCCMSCTEDGIDMTEDVFQASLALLRDEGVIPPQITLGGGEPTLHPRFEDWLWAAVRKCYEVSCMWCLEELANGVYVVTNGSNTEISLNLAKMAKTGIIGAGVSVDDYHNPIDPEVIKAFKVDRKAPDKIDYHDKRNIHKVGLPMKIGRAAETGVGNNPLEDMCICDTWTIDPAGLIHPCGCPGAPPLTSVFDPDWEILLDWSEDQRDGEAHDRWYREHKQQPELEQVS